jgi:hypothetical protein
MPLWLISNLVAHRKPRTGRADVTCACWQQCGFKEHFVAFVWTARRDSSLGIQFYVLMPTPNISDRSRSRLTYSLEINLASSAGSHVVRFQVATPTTGFVQAHVLPGACHFYYLFSLLWYKARKIGSTMPPSGRNRRCSPSHCLFSPPFYWL